MKRAGIYFWLMIKRMGKHPAYWVLLFLFPAAVFVVPKFNRMAADERIAVGYVLEEAESVPAAENDEPYNNGKLSALLEDKLMEDTGGLFQYIRYADSDQLKKDVKTGQIAGGVVFDREFPEKLQKQDYHYCIMMYLPEGMNVGGIMQEDVFQRVYQAYSAVWYAEQLKQKGHQMEPEEVLQKFSEYQREGKVYAVNYEVWDKNGDHVQSASEGAKKTSVLSLRGTLAFLTLLSASLGALDGSRDKKRSMGKGISHPGMLIAAAAGAPVLPAVLFLAGGMIFHDMKMTDASYTAMQADGIENTMEHGLTQAAKFLPELGSALIFGLALWLLAMLAVKVLPRKFLEGIMPCFLLAVLLCCPIFFDLGETIPLFDHISKLFPITWYLEFWGRG